MISLAITCDRCKATVPLNLAPWELGASWGRARQWAQALDWTRPDGETDLCPHCTKAVEAAQERRRKFEETHA